MKTIAPGTVIFHRHRGYGVLTTVNLLTGWVAARFGDEKRTLDLNLSTDEIQHADGSAIPFLARPAGTHAASAPDGDGARIARRRLSKVVFISGRKPLACIGAGSYSQARATGCNAPAVKAGMVPALTIFLIR